jgi:hypothetical protein
LEETASEREYKSKALSAGRSLWDWGLSQWMDWNSYFSPHYVGSDRRNGLSLGKRVRNNLVTPERKRILSELLEKRKNKDRGFIWGLVYIYYNHATHGTYRGTKEIAVYSTRASASRNRKVLIGTGGKYTAENLFLKRRFVRFGEGMYLS